MYKQCVTSQSAKRQRELEQSLLTAMLDRPYEDISISALCDHIGIPRKAFYRYFSGKDGALYALIDHTIMDFAGEVFSDEPQATIDTLERFFCFWRNQRRLLDALDRSGLTGVLLQRSLAKATAEDLLPQRNFSFQPHLPHSYMVYFLISGLLSMVFLWYRNGFQETPRHLAMASAQLMTQPLISRPYLPVQIP